MAYKLYISRTDKNGAWFFVGDIWPKLYSWANKGTPFDVIAVINKELAKYNGIHRSQTNYVEFDTEADAMLFLLKWS